MLSSVATAWVKTLIMPGGGGTQQVLFGEASFGGSTPYPLIYHFWIEKEVPLSYPLLTNGTPFTYRV